jgi:uncharacterized protein (TIGR02145 family)
MSSNTEWYTLQRFLGGCLIAGGSMKASGYNNWLMPNNFATNKSGFTALPGGYRNVLGSFNEVATNGYWWTSKQSSYTNAIYRNLNYKLCEIYENSYNKSIGFSVRCIKD